MNNPPDVVLCNIVARARARATAADTTSLNGGGINDTAMFALIGVGLGSGNRWVAELVVGRIQWKHCRHFGQLKAQEAAGKNFHGGEAAAVIFLLEKGKLREAQWLLTEFPLRAVL